MERNCKVPTCSKKRPRKTKTVRHALKAFTRPQKLRKQPPEAAITGVTGGEAQGSKDGQIGGDGKPEGIYFDVTS